MVWQFEGTGEGSARVTLDDGDVMLLRTLFQQVLELIGPGPAESDDPLAALFAEGPSAPPSNPVLARLFPDAYGGPQGVSGPEEEAAAGEFRRYTETDLRIRKRDDAITVIRALDGLGPEGGVLEVSAGDCPRWLGALNDLRLTLGTHLEVTEETDFFELPDGDPAKPLGIAYLLLGGLQESLLEAMTG